jgi:hypothetical protein
MEKHVYFIKLSEELGYKITQTTTSTQKTKEAKPYVQEKKSVFAFAATLTGVTFDNRSTFFLNSLFLSSPMLFGFLLGHIFLLQQKQVTQGFY